VLILNLSFWQPSVPS